MKDKLLVEYEAVMGPLDALASRSEADVVAVMTYQSLTVYRYLRKACGSVYMRAMAALPGPKLLLRDSVVLKI